METENSSSMRRGSRFLSSCLNLLANKGAKGKSTPDQDQLMSCIILGKGAPGDAHIPADAPADGGSLPLML
jgi:hypothetical protein